MKIIQSFLQFLLLPSTSSLIPSPSFQRNIRTSLHFSLSNYYENNGTTELIEALISRAATPKQLRLLNRGSREYAYQRKRLGEQLRLNRLRYINRHAREEEGFQRARLREQLRFEKNKDLVQMQMMNEDEGPSSIASGKNTTESKNEVLSSSDLSTKLENLRQSVEEAVHPSLNSTDPTEFNSTSSSSLAIYKPDTNANISPLEQILNNNYLPLPPREDASALSLCLAPLAHMITSLFLLGATIFYAIMSVFDTLLNDEKTKSCMKEAGNVWKNCFGHISKAFTNKEQNHILSNLAEASKTSTIALWYITKCTILRSKQSKHANQCLDAATGSLRYGVYTLRSINVIWQRILLRFRSNRQNTKQITKDSSFPQIWRRKFNLSNLLSSIKNSKATKLSRQQYLQLEQQRARLEREYQEKFRSLNQERILLTRERKALDEERSELICESMNLLAWCSTLSTGGTAAAKAESKKGWSWGGWWKAWD